MLRFVALGTSATFPTEKRNHPSFYLEYKGTGMLFDCGEATQKQLRIAKISPNKIKYIFITHWHGDHVLGLPGILFYMANSEYKDNLKIFLPESAISKAEKVIEGFDVPEIEYTLIPVKKGIVLDEKEFVVEAIKGEHQVEVYAYRFREKGYWKLDNDLLKKSGLYGRHRLLSKLKREGKISYKGKEVSIEEVGYLKKGFSLTYITDTIYKEDFISFAKESDILLIESTYFGNEDLAKEHYHMTFEDAKKIFDESGSKIMLITHISQRYEDELESIEKKLLQKYDRVFLLHDFDKFIYEKKQIRMILGGKETIFSREDDGKIKRLT